MNLRIVLMGGGAGFSGCSIYLRSITVRRDISMESLLKFLN